MGTVDALGAVLDELTAAPATEVADEATLVELHRQHARLEAVLATATAAYDAGGEWRADGGRHAATVLAFKCRLPQGVTKRRLHLGRALREMPVTAEAWRAGDVNEAHVSTLAGARNERTAAAFDDAEGMLVGEAKKLRFDHFRRVVAYWMLRVDPDGANRDAAAQAADRRAHLSQSIGGMWFGDLVLDPIRGTILANQLRRIEEELFRDDWAEATARLGEGHVGVDDLRRTAPQRRADAFVEMARRAGTAPAGGRRPEPLFTVHIGYETFAGPLCELAGGAVVAPGSLVPWLDEAWVERVVFDGPSRVIDVGAHRRLFQGATRRAVEVRDRECFHELCDLPAERCEIDHIQPAAHDGPTVQANGRPACGYHNRARHRRRR